MNEKKFLLVERSGYQPFIEDNEVRAVDFYLRKNFSLIYRPFARCHGKHMPVREWARKSRTKRA